MGHIRRLYPSVLQSLDAGIDLILKAGDLVRRADGFFHLVVVADDADSLGIIQVLDDEMSFLAGDDSEAVRLRIHRAGKLCQAVARIHDFRDFLGKTGLRPEEVAYVGDDIPDYDVMREAGLPVAPADAAPEIKRIARYISHCNGGEGVARDLIEQTLKAQGRWMQDEAFGW